MRVPRPAAPPEFWRAQAQAQGPDLLNLPASLGDASELCTPGGGGAPRCTATLEQRPLCCQGKHAEAQKAPHPIEEEKAKIDKSKRTVPLLS